MHSSIRYHPNGLERDLRTAPLVNRVSPHRDNLSLGHTHASRIRVCEHMPLLSHDNCPTLEHLRFSSKGDPFLTSLTADYNLTHRNAHVDLSVRWSRGLHRTSRKTTTFTLSTIICLRPKRSIRPNGDNSRTRLVHPPQIPRNPSRLLITIESRGREFESSAPGQTPSYL